MSNIDYTLTDRRKAQDIVEERKNIDKLVDDFASAKDHLVPFFYMLEFMRCLGDEIEIKMDHEDISFSVSRFESKDREDELYEEDTKTKTITINLPIVENTSQYEKDVNNAAVSLNNAIKDFLHWGEEDIDK